jgi:putative DNA modification/repair radical SAM protein
VDLMQKLSILGESARYDVSCSSSGSTGQREGHGIGSTAPAGICHSWTEDGRCVSLLKVLQTNYCDYDCVYCVNRHSNDIPRAAFSPEELADLTISFYRRNYIEGLFLSSGVVGTPDHTVELMSRTLALLRQKFGFKGYIHAKAIPGASPALIEKLGLLADRISVNIEQCSEACLSQLAPEKSLRTIGPQMAYIAERGEQSRTELVRYRHAPSFAPAGQSTQVIVGVSPERDLQILTTAQSLYDRYDLKRVYYSAYVPVNTDVRLPMVSTVPPLLREHRLYQADWLLRFYRFQTHELLDARAPDLDLEIDPKCAYALRHLDSFPIEINRADYDTLLRVPGIGIRSAKKIIEARRYRHIRTEDLKHLGLVMKRAMYFITCDDRLPAVHIPTPETLRLLLADNAGRRRQSPLQMSISELSYAY